MHLREVVYSNLVVCGLRADTWEEVLRHLAGLLRENNFVKDSFVEAVLERERQMPTGIPVNEISVAVPHGDVEHVLAPAVAVATLDRPVPFRVMVNPQEVTDVSLVFMLALDKPDAQIQALQEVALLLQQPWLLQRLVVARSPKEIRRFLFNDEGS